MSTCNTNHNHASTCCGDVSVSMTEQPSQPSASPPKTKYFTIPEDETRSVSVQYINSDEAVKENRLLDFVLQHTPKPRGKTAFSSVHCIALPPSSSSPSSTDKTDAESAHTLTQLHQQAQRLNKEFVVHYLPQKTLSGDVMDEYEAIFETTSSIILAKADRASLLVFIGNANEELDAFASQIAMLPFRGVQVALLSQKSTYGNPLHYTTPSGLFDIDAAQSNRMGMYPISAVFGSLAAKSFSTPVQQWVPISISETLKEHKTAHLPFKIGGLELPMITHSASYDDALMGLSRTLARHYPDGYVPVVSCGETVDGLGYAHDLMMALGQEDYFYYTHKSGETYKRYSEYGRKDLFAKLLSAKYSSTNRPIVIIAVGGGVNGNCIGLIAGMTGSHFIEVPTTPMHYNDATTSAKKAVSLVVNNKILSKNIMGCFYLPQLVYCVNEMFITCSSANIHATVGEAAKTMNMLGVANSAVGASDYSDILGATEFASDFTKIIKEVDGFEKLITFINDRTTQSLKHEVLQYGQAIREARFRLKPLSSTSASSGAPDDLGCMLSAADTQAYNALVQKEIAALQEMRRVKMIQFRSRFYQLPVSTTDSIRSFLTVINKEVVSAKAMFLAYEDPFEKYRALLFEYAHTLGHGIEAFANGLYHRCHQQGLPVPPEAFKLHGQCVGMAVTWAGQMSADLGVLSGEGLALHQSFVAIFNRFGGFSFAPVRALCETLGVSKEEMCEGVLAVIRKDNKRGYCKCSGPAMSVDQLVCDRPGKMLKSNDHAASLRYLVEVAEEQQKDVLGRAFDLEFDHFADLETVTSEGQKYLVFKKNRGNTSSDASVHSIDIDAKQRPDLDVECSSSSADVAQYVHDRVSYVYHNDQTRDQARGKSDFHYGGGLNVKRFRRSHSTQSSLPADDFDFDFKKEGQEEESDSDDDVCLNMAMLGLGGNGKEASGSSTSSSTYTNHLGHRAKWAFGAAALIFSLLHFAIRSQNNVLDGNM